MKQFTITLQGRTKTWTFDFLGDPTDWPSWEADGLTVHLLVNRIPAWVPAWVPTKWWFRVQDVFHFTDPGEGGERW